MTKPKIIIVVLLVLTAVCVAVVIRLSYPLSKLVDSVVYGNKNHYLACDQLPDVEKVGRVVKEHKDVVERIVKTAGERVRGSAVTPVWEVSETGSEGRVSDIDKAGTFTVEFLWGEPYSFQPAKLYPDPGCLETGKGDIEITVIYVQDRAAVEKIIGGDTFFGIPYRMPNQ